MQKLEIHKTEILQGGETEETISTADLMRICLNRIPTGGYDADTMTKRLKIIDKIAEKKPGDLVELEDAEFEELKKNVIDMRWQMMHKDIAKFDKYIRSL